MLKIGYGCPDSCIYNADLEFDEWYEMDWLSDEMNLRILREVDHAELYAAGLHDLTEKDRTFGIFDISSGSKALMLVNMLEEPIIWGTLFGDNCSDILLDLAKEKEVVIYLSHLLLFPEQKFRAFSIVKGREYADYAEYTSEAVKGVVGCI